MVNASDFDITGITFTFSALRLVISVGVRFFSSEFYPHDNFHNHHNHCNCHNDVHLIMETSDGFNIKLSQSMASGGQEIQARVHLARDNLVTKEEICNM